MRLTSISLFIGLFCLLALTNVLAQKKKPDTASAQEQISAVLDAQTEAWNKGNLEEFMKGYWHSPKLTFYSAGNVRAGYDAVLERYRKTYQADGKEMGQVAFSDVDIELLGNQAAVVRGRWALTFKDGKKIGGLYTLLFRHFKKTGWKIIHDHTSSNE